MELLVGAGVDEAAQEIKSRGEAAFLIGTMLLFHVLLGVDRRQPIGGLTLPDDMEQALNGYRLRWGACSALRSAWAAASP